MWRVVALIGWLAILPGVADAELVDSRVAVLESQFEQLNGNVSRLNDKVATKEDIARLERQIGELKQYWLPKFEKLEKMEEWKSGRDKVTDDIRHDIDRIEVCIFGVLGAGGAGISSVELLKRRKRRNGKNASQS